MEMPGIEPGAFHMQSERSTTEPHPLWSCLCLIVVDYINQILKQQKGRYT